MKVLVASCIFAFCLSFAGACIGASLKGTHASLEQENQEADECGMTRIESDEMLQYFKSIGLLVRVPNTFGVRSDNRLDEKWAWVRPWVAEFLEDLGRDFMNDHQSSFEVSSAVRTFEYQNLLRQANSNAAPVIGNRRTTHSTGATVDITKRFLTRDQITWLRKRLLALEARGLIHATEEFTQTVFHVMVLKKYGSRWKESGHLD